MIYLIFFIYVVSCSLGMVLVKYGGRYSTFGINSNLLSLNMNWIFICGLLLYVVSFFLWMYIIQKFQLAFISPIAYGLSFVVMIIFAYFILGERISTPQLIGSALIIAGVFISYMGTK